MQTVRRHANPFALMIDPQAVIAQVASSRHLDQLQRRVCRPLDKPLLGAAGEGDDEAAQGVLPTGSSAAADDGLGNPVVLSGVFAQAGADGSAAAADGGARPAADLGN